MVKPRRRRLDELHTCAAFNVRKTARAVGRAFDAALEPSGVDAAMFSLLAWLAGNSGASVREIADGLVMDPATASRHLRPAQRRGFVRISVGEDRRRRLAHLTGKGRDTLKRAVPYWLSAQRSLAADLGAGDLTRMLADLQELRGAARRLLERERPSRRPAA